MLDSFRLASMLSSCRCSSICRVISASTKSSDSRSSFDTLRSLARDVDDEFVFRLLVPSRPAAAGGRATGFDVLRARCAAPVPCLTRPPRTAPFPAVSFLQRGAPIPAMSALVVGSTARDRVPTTLLVVIPRVPRSVSAWDPLSSSVDRVVAGVKGGRYALSTLRRPVFDGKSVAAD